MFSLNSSFKMALASSDLLCSGGILNVLFLSAIYVTGSNHVTHGQLFCKEISDVNIWTWVVWAKRVVWAKKVAVSGGLSTVWGFCRLGGRYFKNWRMLYCAKLNSIQPSTKIYAKICFILTTIAPNCVQFWMIYLLKLCFQPYLHLASLFTFEDCHVFFNLIAYLDWVNTKINWR